MNSITYTQRYYPHELKTRYHACLLYQNKRNTITYVCRRYKISKASLMRWMKRFDGTKESLMDKSHRPKTPHPNSHTEEENTWIKNLLRRNPYISMIELYTKLLDRGYARHPSSLFRYLQKQGFYKQTKETKKTYIPKPYYTPKQIGIKWQLDVKYVPKHTKAPTIPRDKNFYQYTVIDEASRERYIYHYTEQSACNTVDFIKRAIQYFKYQPKIIQTDNGSEFTYTRKTELIHPMDQLCAQLHIHHQRIRPRTPRHNGKVERSHRTDNQRFYSRLSFYSLEDLRKQAAIYLERYNTTAMSTLGYTTPVDKRKELLKQGSSNS